MDANIKKANIVKIATVIKNLEKRNITGHYCETAEDAVKTVLGLIPEGSEVSWGGSVTLNEIGIKDAVSKAGFKVNDPMSFTDPEEALQARRMSLMSDVFLSSLNAITLDGEILNIDGTGNRVAAIVFGPKKVILIAGANKIAADYDSAMARIKCDACPPNTTRLGKQTPCAVTGKCTNCLSKGQTICCHTVATRFSGIDDRMHVVLINENFGF